jgi:hypothetical protein
MLCAFLHQSRVLALSSCAVRMSALSRSIVVSVPLCSVVAVLQWMIHVLAAFDSVSSVRVGVFWKTKRSVGRAMIGSLLCVSGAKSGHRDNPSVQLVIPGLYMSLIGYSSHFAMYPET